MKLQNLKKFNGVIDEINFSDVQTLFQGFNEGITEMFTQSIIGIEGQPEEFSYQDQVDLVYGLLKQVCGKNKNCHMELAQNYFFGNFTFMQKVKQTYGKGSVKLLSELKTEEYISRLDISDSEKIELSKMRKEILDFFMTDDVDKREELRSKLLGNETNAKAHNK